MLKLLSRHIFFSFSSHLCEVLTYTCARSHSVVMMLYCWWHDTYCPSIRDPSLPRTRRSRAYWGTMTRNYTAERDEQQLAPGLGKLL
ncbi:hypothetical protein F5B22DRAFT_200461 [Xylaria bambusicola]|uniref:uncharacterized protein n=1 Tax=Xylaria bambusicola TaxID=326684 RepID=UPI0020082182|nr:uncharacterized protein F5B22DRAFT_200461 [Xylaria bambusicola]KAI0515068.1 hypothetical protein F5B22DRAFT_200461 [Xylaria bambusicola]